MTKHHPRVAVFITGTLIVAALWMIGRNPAEEAKQSKDPIAFFLIGDTHILADKKDSTTLDDRSNSNNAGLVEMLNNLPGTEIPKLAGGGKVSNPRGVIHAGDVIDTGDQANLKAQQTEWTAFSDWF